MRGYTHDDLALLVGCNSSTLSYLERGLVCPKPLTVSLLADALGVTPATLWD